MFKVESKGKRSKKLFLLFGGFLYEELGINTLCITVFFGTIQAIFDQIFLALLEFFLTSYFAFIEVVEIDGIAEVGQRKIGDGDHAGHPDNQFEESKNHSLSADAFVDNARLGE